MAAAVVANVESLCVSAVEELDARTEIGLGSLDQQMDVVVHQAIREAAPTLPDDNLGQDLQIEMSVGHVAKHDSTVVAARVGVVNASRDIFARFTGHPYPTRGGSFLAPLTGSDPLNERNVKGV